MSTDPADIETRDTLRKCLDICEQLIAEGRELEALDYLNERILPVLEEAARRQMREQP